MSINDVNKYLFPEEVVNGKGRKKSAAKLYRRQLTSGEYGASNSTWRGEIIEGEYSYNLLN